jgi:hypothetical protein
LGFNQQEMLVMNKWDYLEEEYEMYSQVEKIQKSMKPTGSLTDNRRIVEPARNAHRKRAQHHEARELKQQFIY